MHTTQLAHTIPLYEIDKKQLLWLTTKSVINSKHGLHKAFTLAEVLITLTIIGVIAAMTIPTLMHKTKDQQTVAQLRKAQSVLAQAAKMAILENGTLAIGTHEEWNITKNIKIIKDCYNNQCPEMAFGHGPFSLGAYIISNDGIVYGFHQTLILNKDEHYWEGWIQAIAVGLYPKNNTIEKLYGFYIKEDGTVIPAGRPQDVLSDSFNKNEEVKTLTCPGSSTKGSDGKTIFERNAYCTYWTLMTGKVNKKAGEWID